MRDERQPELDLFATPPLPPQTRILPDHGAFIFRQPLKPREKIEPQPQPKKESYLTGSVSISDLELISQIKKGQGFNTSPATDEQVVASFSGTQIHLLHSILAIVYQYPTEITPEIIRRHFPTAEVAWRNFMVKMLNDSNPIDPLTRCRDAWDSYRHQHQFEDSRQQSLWFHDSISRKADLLINNWAKAYTSGSLQFLRGQHNHFHEYSKIINLDFGYLSTGQSLHLQTTMRTDLITHAHHRPDVVVFDLKNKLPDLADPDTSSVQLLQAYLMCLGVKALTDSYSYNGNPSVLHRPNVTIPLCGPTIHNHVAHDDIGHVRFSYITHRLSPDGNTFECQEVNFPADMGERLKTEATYIATNKDKLYSQINRYKNSRGFKQPQISIN
ncbi:hypothetical protein M1116_02590 [Patescibacteria group bacterium]|nr:hypothetical protein [Patescibacteria group bacterium]